MQTVLTTEACTEHAFLPFSLFTFHFLSLSDIDPVTVTPAQPQVVMLGDKVEWQCKTKGSAAHTVHWKKVGSIASSDIFCPFLEQQCPSKDWVFLFFQSFVSEHS